MEKEECENCFSDITVKVDKLVNVAKNAIVSMNHAHTVSLEEREKQSKDFIKSQEEKHDKYLAERKNADTLAEKARNRRDAFGLIVFTILCGVIGYNYLETNRLKTEVGIKANKNEVLRIDDAQTIRELGDKYYDSRYVIRDGAEPDPINYKQFVETLFERASRGENIKN